MENEVRLIEITEEQLLAIKAMAYGCANNKRLVGASYMTGLTTDNPQSIPFGKAWVIVQEFVEEPPTIDPESLINEELKFTRKFIHEHGLDFALAEALSSTQLTSGWRCRRRMKHERKVEGRG
jgi:hypothetical protein